MHVTATVGSVGHCNICDFPLELFYWIQEFVNINHVLLTTSLLGAYRHQLYRWDLTERGSVEYLNRACVISSLMDAPERQVCFKYWHFESVPRIHAFSPIYTLDIYSQVYTLDLSDCTGVKDVSAFGKVHTLYISGCTGVTDVSALSKLHTLHMRGCIGVTNVSALHNLHKLRITRCTGVTDVSALGNVPRLIR